MIQRNGSAVWKPEQWKSLKRNRTNGFEKWWQFKETLETASSILTFALPECQKKRETGRELIWRNKVSFLTWGRKQPGPGSTESLKQDEPTEVSTKTHMTKWQKIKNFFFFPLRVAPVARSGFGAAAAGLCHSHSNAGSQLHFRPTLQLTAVPDPLTHWARPGIELTSSWILVGFVTAGPKRELWFYSFLMFE